MLKTSVDRYISLRRTLGYRLDYVAKLLHSFADFASGRGDTHIRVSTAVDWATVCSSPLQRNTRLQSIVHLARFLHAEDPEHELPPSHLFSTKYPRPLPYIYSSHELARLIGAARQLRQTYSLRRETYATLFGLLAATGLRISEALDLRISDLLEDSVLLIRCGKGGKSRVVPLHPTAANALGAYLEARRRLPDVDDHLFLSAGRRKISHEMANYTFRRVLILAGIGQTGGRRCRIHDIRHTFATRSLEKCPHRRENVARHFVALATYLGHTQIAHTYWYLEATPKLMKDIAKAADALIGKEPA